jgi:nucleotide-binding universal stress UspA family protein
MNKGLFSSEASVVELKKLFNFKPFTQPHKKMEHRLAHSFLVPLDFTERSYQALQYAAEIVKKHDGIIHLLHVVDDRTDHSRQEMEQLNEKITLYAQEQQLLFKVSIIPNIVSGNIFNSIGDTARKLGVQLIIMGIHGMHGIQFIIGSFAARVILGSPVPVILTNGTVTFTEFNNLVLPFDPTLPMDKLLQKTIELGLQFNSTIHIYSRREDGSFLHKHRTETKIKKAIEQIQKAGLTCQCIMINSSPEDFANNIVTYAHNIKADLIMITTQSQHDSKEYIIVENGIKLMEKSKTPLYFLNPS